MAGRISKSINQIYNKIWHTALYIRLSQEDEDIGREKQESNSITSQKELLDEYVKENEDMVVHDIYVDDGFTGTDFNRPSFQRLLGDIKNRNINCIVVKDLSRLGRNYIEVGNYLEQVFPAFNIRFIAINDNIDSFKNPSSANNIIVPFKNLINDEYCRDTSLKIRSSLNSKKRKGEFIGAFASYGYIKNPQNKHELVVDNIAAKVVKNIFDWYVEEGLGKIAICHRLNDLGILNPTGHKRLELGQNYRNFGIKNDTYAWTPSTIRNILCNEIYIGNTVQGKRRTKSYKIHMIENVPKEDWVRVENTHRAIINLETFKKAQILNNMDVKASQKTKQISIWAGILKCADCGFAMNKKSSTNNVGKNYEYYICSTYRKKSKALCTKHTIRAKDLEKVVLTVINMHINSLNDIEKIVERVKCKSDEDNNIKNMIELKEKEISKISKFKMSLYGDWKNGDITREEYTEYKQKYELDIEKINMHINNLKDEMKKNILKQKEKVEWLEKFKEQKKIDTLSRNIVIELIDYILVHENGNITIKFKFKN